MSKPRAGQPRYVVAVSGGVDSVVLLHMLVSRKIGPLVVAHVDHGIRPESGDDAAFVRQLAQQYRIRYEQASLRLGANASEDDARRGRYNFLRRLQEKYNGPILTAHHADDVIETIALHLQRGTGWRGLAVMGAEGIHRPLTVYFKDEIVAYAGRHDLAWREDASNQDQRYARNRVRPILQKVPKSVRLELLALWKDQQQRARLIDTEIAVHTTNQRHFYIMAPPHVAREVLRSLLLAEGVGRTRPQLDELVLACKTAKEGTRRSLGSGHMMVFSKTDFRILPRQKK